MTTQTKTEIVIAAIDKATAIINKIGEKLSWMEKPMADVTAASKRVMATVAGLSVVYAGAMAAVFAFGKSSADAADKVGDLASRYGAATEDVQIFGAALEEGTGTVEDAASGLGRLNRMMNEAIHKGGDAREAFLGMGISMKQLENLKPAEVMERMADAFSKSNEDGKKLDILQTLLGKSGSVWKDTLDKGSAALKERAAQMRADGRIFTQQQIEQADSFDKAFQRTKGTFQGLKNSLGLQLLPALQKVLESVQKWAVQNRELIDGKFNEFVVKLPKLIDTGWKALELMWRIVQKLAAGFDWLYEKCGPTLTAIAALTIILGPLIFSIGQAVFAIGKIVWGFLNMIGVIPVAMKWLSALWALILANPVTALIAALAALAVAVYVNWDSIVAYVGKAWERIKAMFSVSFFDGVIQVWMESWQGMFNSILGLIKTILPDNWLPQALRDYQITVANNRAGQVTAAQAAAQKMQVEGLVKIKIDSEGKPKVTELKSNNPSMDIDVSAGLVMAGS